MVNTLTIGMGMASVLLAFIMLTVLITKLQRTNDRLTDKLMARDYREYRTYAKPEEKVEEETDKLSFYDQ